ncbi:rhodanese-like domain-containing protein [Aestuariispira insulae]|uniref:Rhodanese-related sulfurtransferase n=1 Tax=Aestuariispira insulae TaxID=1461337 RepID=A0A3D9HWU8_9PROT|nr:rhodanese-like domain-containing protein [Aestuariispira insulae]RED53982.1 rhodanese-related sulfurtransferase [Aestuariispira insulae]
MASPVTETPAAPSDKALDHFKARLGFEADCWDTHEAMATGNHDFILLDVRPPDCYEAAHVPGAINLPHRKIIQRKMAEFPANTLFVVYCEGPHCNGANKAAIRLAELGLPVKEMIGGMTGWADEGFDFANGPEPGHVRQK